jgi:fumarate hydratase subunit beta
MGNKEIRVMSKSYTLTTPLTNKEIEVLDIGDKVFLNGVIYTARDAAHQRLVDLITAGQPLPFDPEGQVIYYVGPSPARPGRVVGAAGPTTSYRMDAYAPTLIRLGLKGMIGKGKRSAEVIEAMKTNKAVYLGATGGAGALIARAIKASEVIAYPELGPEAIRRMVVENFPAVVINDTQGRDLYEEGIKQYRLD